ncbi:hypothetical protein [Streptococcus mitis]|nr:hypothetical protein [Streptococcus mitis]
MFVAGNFVITLLRFILELVKETKKGSIIFVVGKSPMDIMEPILL